MLKEDRETFDEMVNETLRRHFHVIKELVARGTYFFDYGNSFMKAIYDAGVKEISRNGTDEKDGFIWPSYVEDIMGPQFRLWLRSLPLGMPEREKGRFDKDRPCRYGVYP